MSSRYFGRLLVALLLLMCAPSHDAAGHVAPAVKKNNRYIKLTVFPDSVRLAYIIYIGEIPGSAARARMDANRDGRLSAEETQSFSNDWATRVRSALSIEGASSSRLDWDSVEIGLGDESTSGGAFSLDLVAWVCVDPGRRKLVIRDTFVVPEAGETEVLPEESPGTELTSVLLAGKSEPTLRWTGSASPLGAGLELRWTAADETVSQRCSARAHEQTTTMRRWWLLIAAAIGSLALLALLVWRRRT